MLPIETSINVKLLRKDMDISLVSKDGENDVGKMK